MLLVGVLVASLAMLGGVVGLGRLARSQRPDPPGPRRAGRLDPVNDLLGPVVSTLLP